MLEDQSYVGGDGRRLVHEHRDHEQEQSAAHDLRAVVAAGAVDHPLQADGLEGRDDVEERGEDQDEQGAAGVDVDRRADEQADPGEGRAAPVPARLRGLP